MQQVSNEEDKQKAPYIAWRYPKRARHAKHAMPGQKEQDDDRPQIKCDFLANIFGAG